VREVVEIAKSQNEKVSIYIDIKEVDDVEPFLKEQSNFETYVLFRQQVFENRRNREIYKKVKGIKSKCNNLFEIRFNSGKNQNDRIYCLEFHDGKRRIVLSKLFYNKRSQQINKRLKNLLKSICKRKYTF